MKLISSWIYLQFKLYMATESYLFQDYNAELPCKSGDQNPTFYSFNYYSKTNTLPSCQVPYSFKKSTITFRTIKDNQPAYLADLLVRPKCSKYQSYITSNIFVVPRIKTKTWPRAFSTFRPALWNALPVQISDGETILTFRKLLWSHLFDLPFPPQLLSSPAPMFPNFTLYRLPSLQHYIAQPVTSLWRSRFILG